MRTRPQVGIVYTPGMREILSAIPGAFDVLEIEPQTLSHTLAGRPGAAHPSELDLAEILRFPHPKVVHSVGMPFGNHAPPTPAEIAGLRFALDAVDSPWVSDHLSFNSAARGFAGFLLPLPQTDEAVVLAAERIRGARCTLERPVLFETGVNYLRPSSREMSDGMFFASVADSADCGILLDLHNLWTNERNGRQRVLEVVDEIPRERVIEVHLANGMERSGYWIDAHSGLSTPALLELAASVLPQLPNLRLITFEIAADYVPASNLTPDDLPRHLGELRRLTYGSPLRTSDGTASACGARPSVQDGPLGGLEAWREALTALANGRTPGPEALSEMDKDPGVDLYRDLVGVGRAGLLVSAVPLTLRYLLMLGGSDLMESTVRTYLARTFPALLPLDEATGFEAHLERSPIRDAAYVHEVLRFERAVLQTAADGCSRSVRFSTEPTALLRDLGAGRPPDLPARDQSVYELTIDATSTTRCTHVSPAQAGCPARGSHAWIG